MHHQELFTAGHGVKTAGELVATLLSAGCETLVDVRRFPSSRRNPQFNQGPLREALAEAGMAYSHAVELGGLLSEEPGETDFPCVRVRAFRSYAARMRTPAWQRALELEVTRPRPCLMCAETSWERCHRRMIADFLVAKGHAVSHLLGPERREAHRLYHGSEAREGRLYLCGQHVG
jgi:uncharacterized protein (DUF488 family)